MDTPAWLGDIPIERKLQKDFYNVMVNHLCMETNKQTRLKSYLESKGIKQTWLAKKTGITQAWVNKIVNGSEPRVRDAIRIADALGLDVKDLWPLEEDD